MSDKQLTMMIEAILINNKQLWWIGGYIPGLTSQGDPYVLLFHPAEGMKEKVVKVYHNDFGKLPSYIDTSTPAGVRASKSNMNKDDGRLAGLYVEVSRFKILTINGKDTSMGPERRFYNTLWAPHDGGIVEQLVYECGDPVGVRAVDYFNEYVKENGGKRPFSRDHLIDWYKRKEV